MLRDVLQNGCLRKPERPLPRAFHPPWSKGGQASTMLPTPRNVPCAAASLQQLLSEGTHDQERDRDADVLDIVAERRSGADSAGSWRALDRDTGGQL